MNCLPLLPILQAEEAGRGKQAHKHCDRKDQRTSKPPQIIARSKD
jgi:hypothetical protein